MLIMILLTLSFFIYKTQKNKNIEKEENRKMEEEKNTYREEKEYIYCSHAFTNGDVHRCGGRRVLTVLERVLVRARIRYTRGYVHRRKRSAGVYIVTCVLTHSCT